MRALPLLLLAVACGGKGGETKPPATKDDAGPAAPADATTVTLPPAPPLPAVPAGLPAPRLPASVTPDAVALGQLLFWDTRLSLDNKRACATCHDPRAGFASGQLQETAGGKPFPRRAPALVNLAWHDEYGWDGRYGSLDAQLDAHVLGQLGNGLDVAVARLADLPGYRAHFTRLAGASAAPLPELARRALGAFVLTRYEGDAPWDRLERSPDVPAELKAGYQLFSTKAQCATCHTPPLYTDHRYHRLGLVASSDEGRGKLDPAKRGAFKTPSLRGAARREGFFHDASAATLDAAIDWHLAGGVGQGADPSIVDLTKVNLGKAEREQLGAFVRALTDPRNGPPPERPALP